MRKPVRLASPRRSSGPSHPVAPLVLAACFLFGLPVGVMAQWERTVDDALNQAESTGKPVIVLVTGGDWCDPCTWMEDNSLTSPELRARLRDNWIAVRIPDTDPAWQRWEVERLPTILYLDPQGREVERTEGAVTADSMVRTMTEVRRELVIAGDGGDEDADGEDAAVANVTGLQMGTRYRIGSGVIWNDGGALWFTEDAGLPPRLEEYDQDETFLYLRDGSSGTILAITVAEGVQPSLWRWNQSERRWRELGELEPAE
ncbi:MAG: thioredoxin family protein [Alkalispirochaeta sp.]